MDNEVNFSASFAIELVILAMVLSTILSFVSIGQQFSRTITSQVSNSIDDGYALELQDMSQYGSVPAAAVYTAVEQNQNIVSSISGSAYGVTISNVSDLQKLFQYKVRIAVSEGINGTLSITVSPGT